VPVPLPLELPSRKAPGVDVVLVRAAAFVITSELHLKLELIVVHR
jgi:hypothetical protein